MSLENSSEEQDDGFINKDVLSVKISMPANQNSAWGLCDVVVVVVSASYQEIVESGGGSQERVGGGATLSVSPLLSPTAFQMHHLLSPPPRCALLQSPSPPEPL